MERSNAPSYVSNAFETSENANQRAMQEIIRYARHLDKCIISIISFEHKENVTSF